MYKSRRFRLYTVYTPFNTDITPLMKRFGNISPQVETLDNFRRAFYDYARQKMFRRAVQKFEANLDHNIGRLLDA